MPERARDELALAATPELHRAVAEGDTMVVLRLLAQGANPNAEDAVFGEPPLFEAAVADAVSVVVLLLLFSADVTRTGRNSSATAAAFAPSGGAAAQLLEAVAHGNAEKSMALGSAAVGPVVSEVAVGSREAVVLDWRLKAVGHPGVPWRSGADACSGEAPPQWPPLDGDLGEPLAAGSAVSMGVLAPRPPGARAAAAAVVRPGKESSQELMRELNARLAEQRLAAPWSGPSLLLSHSGAAHVAWATVSAFAPREALAILPTVSGSFAALLLDELDDTSWRHATSLVAEDLAASDARRRHADGSAVSWRHAFQEVTTQRLYSWGVDGIVTGFGSRAAQKSYSRPSVLWEEFETTDQEDSARTPAAPSGAGRERGAAPGGGALRGLGAVRDIACGRRHSAVTTFAEGVYVWGRDVLPPLPPPDDATVGFLRRGKSRSHAWDRPTRLGADGAASPSGAAAPPSRRPSMDGGGAAPSPVASSPSASSPAASASPHGGPGAALSPALSETLLQLAGGWVAPEAAADFFADPPPLMADGEALRFETPATATAAPWRAPAVGVVGAHPDERLPPLRKLVRSASFNVALALDGRCFVWRDPGLLATGAASRLAREPKPMLPAGEIAVDVVVGEGHAAILTERGQVWTFGWRHRSALGRGPRPLAEAVTEAFPVPGLEGVVQVGAGATFTLCVDVAGALWLFGEGPCIIGCFNDPLAVHEPRRVPPEALGGRRVLAATCGEGHVLVLTAWDPCCRLPQPGAWFNCRSAGDESLCS